MDILKNIEILKSDLRKQKLTLEEVFQKHIIDGENFLFKYKLNNSELEYEVRSLIATALRVHIHEVIIVGSAKTGYSLSPKKLFNTFDQEFDKSKKNKDKSDLDIAIVSTELFDFIGRNMFEFTDSYQKKWEFNDYYDASNTSQFTVPINYKFFEYYTKGWFRPDFMPIGYDFCEVDSYPKLKQKVQSITGRKLALGIYRDWYFFKNYHIDNLNKLMIASKRELL